PRLPSKGPSEPEHDDVRVAAVGGESAIPIGSQTQACLHAVGGGHGEEPEHLSPCGDEPEHLRLGTAEVAIVREVEATGHADVGVMVEELALEPELTRCAFAPDHTRVALIEVRSDRIDIGREAIAQLRSPGYSAGRVEIVDHGAASHRGQLEALTRRKEAVARRAPHRTGSLRVLELVAEADERRVRR